MYANNQYASSQKKFKFKNLRFFGKRFSLLVGLHVEHCLLSFHGKFVKECGLYEILANSNLPTIDTKAAVNANHKKTGQLLASKELLVLHKQNQKKLLKVAQYSHLLSGFRNVKNQDKCASAGTRLLICKLI